MKKKYYLFLNYGLVLDSIQVPAQSFFKTVDEISKFYEIRKFESAFDERETYSYYDPYRDMFVSIGYVKEVDEIL